MVNDVVLVKDFKGHFKDFKLCWSLIYIIYYTTKRIYTREWKKFFGLWNVLRLKDILSKQIILKCLYYVGIFEVLLQPHNWLSFCLKPIENLKLFLIFNRSYVILHVLLKLYVLLTILNFWSFLINYQKITFYS